MYTSACAFKYTYKRYIHTYIHVRTKKPHTYIYNTRQAGFQLKPIGQFERKIMACMLEALI